MIWRVFFTPKAEQDLKRLPKPKIQRIKDELNALAEEAHPRHHVKKLKNHLNNPIYSHRVGRYRIILTVGKWCDGHLCDRDRRSIQSLLKHRLSKHSLSK